MNYEGALRSPMMVHILASLHALRGDPYLTYTRDVHERLRKRTVSGTVRRQDVTVEEIDNKKSGSAKTA